MHLTRLDYPNKKVKGWQVRLPKWHPEGPGTLYFSDSRYGGSAKSHAAARLYRDKVFAKHGLSLYAKGRTRAKAWDDVTAVGVFAARDSRKPAGQSWAWYTFWSTRQGQRRASFAFHVHGFERALLKAVRLREKHTDVLLPDEAIVQSALLAWLRWTSVLR